MSHFFLRITIFLSLINVFLFFLFYSFTDFEFSKKVFETNRFIIVIFRFFYFFLRIRKIKHLNLFKLTFYLIITELFFDLCAQRLL